MRKILVSLILSIFILGTVAIPVSASKTTADSNNSVPDYIRLHVRANSDSKEDQALKLSVRDTVLEFTSALLKDNLPDDKKSALEILEKNLDDLKTVCEETLRSAGKSDAVKISLCREKFLYTEYDGFFLPEGIYDSLIVEIGKGKGANWWCVVYPSVCSSFEGEITTDPSVLPESLRLAQTPAPASVKLDFWIVGVVSRFIDFILNK